MKCRVCGNTEVNMYKEIRGIIAEMGITKEDIQNEIKITIDSYIRSAMSQNIKAYIQDSVKSIVQKEIASASWGKPTKVQEILRECLRDLVMRELSGIDINISIKERSERS